MEILENVPIYVIQKRLKDRALPLPIQNTTISLFFRGSKSPTDRCTFSNQAFCEVDGPTVGGPIQMLWSYKSGNSEAAG